MKTFIFILAVGFVIVFGWQAGGILFARYPQEAIGVMVGGLSGIPLGLLLVSMQGKKR